MLPCGGRAVALVLCLGVAFLPHGAAPAAAAADVFTVAGLPVDASAESADAARDLAVATGERRAVERLFARLVPKRERSRLPALEERMITDLVQGIEVEGERVSARRYAANLTVRFQPEAVRRLLREAGLPFAETRSKPVVVLPVLRAGGEILLWEDPNPWREAWVETSGRDDLVPIVVPLGDLSDVAVIVGEQAIRGDGERLHGIAERYGAADSLVAVARVEEEPGVPARVEYSVSRFGPTAIGQTFVNSVTGAAGEGVEALLRLAANEVAERIEEGWKGENLLRFDRERELVVTVPLDSLAAWLEVKRRLDGVAFVRESRLVALSRREARLRLRTIGDDSQLQNALAQSDLRLTAEGGEWRLRLDVAGAMGDSLSFTP